MISKRLSLPATIAGALSQSASFAVVAWRALTVRHLLYTLLLGAAWSAIMIASATSYFMGPIPAGPVLNSILTMQFNGFAVLFAVVLADRASPPALRRWWPYVIAVPAGVAVGSLLTTLVSQHVLGIASAYPAEEFGTFFFRHATHGLAVCGLATFVYVSQRWAAHSAAALRDVQRQSAEAEKRVLETRLAAMQARVEPQFLQNALTQVERLYETDTLAADHVLKGLIGYLRAAIPQIREPVSTVAREIRLANAYLNIVRSGSADLVLVTAAGAAIAEESRLPPMILLPLINHALARRTERANEIPRLEVDVAVRDDRLRLTIFDQGAGFAVEGENGSTIVHIRERLAMLYGSRAWLRLEGAGARSWATMEIPREIAPDAMKLTVDVRHEETAT